MKRITNLICSITFLFVCLMTFGQGNIEIIKDPRIDDLIKKQGEPIPPAPNVQINGYRLQIFFDSEKSKVDQVRSQFAKSFPKTETYVTYNAPNYFLRVGDFRTSLEADRLKAEVGTTYPTSFIIQEKVNLPRID
jgi:hypothetical protein